MPVDPRDILQTLTSAEAPSVQLRQWSKAWPKPGQWRDATVGEAWTKALKMAATTVVSKEETEAKIASVLQSLRRGSIALNRVSKRTAGRRELARSLKEVAAGLFGTAMGPDGRAVTKIPPPRLVVRRALRRFGAGLDDMLSELPLPAGVGQPGEGGVVVYTAEVEGAQFDARAAAFAEAIDTYVRGLAVSAEGLARAAEGPGKWEQRAAVVEKAAPVALGALIVGGLVLVLLRR